MKTQNLIFTLALFLLLSGSSLAHNDNDPSFEKNETKTTAVAFDAALQPSINQTVIFRCMNKVYDKLIVKLYDDKGILLHSKSVYTKGNIKLTYDVKQLPVGEFNVKVFSRNRAIYSQTFNLANDKHVYVNLD